MKHHLQFLCFTLPLLLSSKPAASQPTARKITGVATARGVPIPGLNIFDIETLEGAVTGDDGRFVISIADSSRTSMHLVARRIGFSPVDTTIVLAGLESVTITLREVAVLVPITVQAGRYTANATRCESDGDICAQGAVQIVVDG